jgi:hypothetical protein
MIRQFGIIIKADQGNRDRRYSLLDKETPDEVYLDTRITETGSLKPVIKNISDIA